MILGYNTNGFAHHSLESAIVVIGAIGYRSVAITLDHGALNPFDAHHIDQLTEIRRILLRHDLLPVIETGGRFLLDPVQKHEPTLVSPDKDLLNERVSFYRYAIDVAAELRAACVSLWSGVAHDAIDFQPGLERLLPHLEAVLQHASDRGVIVAFEPEPGMLVDTLDKYAQLKSRLGNPEHLRLTLDVGHLHCNGETPIADQVVRFADQIANVHIEDMRLEVHEHLMFGEGEIDFPPVIAALKQIGYDGPLTVELSRHSHQAPEAARQSFIFLSPLVDSH